MPEITEEQRKALEEKIKNMSPEELREFQKQQCIFCQIIKKKIPSKIVFEDNKSIAILDINPAIKGHILILPKEHYSIMPQIPKEDLDHLYLVSKYLSQALLKTIRTTGTNIFIANGVIAGQRAQHFILHLIPRKEGDKILDINEKIIDPKLRTQVKSLVEKRLNELLGIKKEVVNLSEKENITEDQKNISSVKESANETKKEKLTEEESLEKEDKIETKISKETTEENNDKNNPKIESKTKRSTKKKKKESEESDSEIKENQPTLNSKKSINLDDIADLFR